MTGEYLLDAIGNIADEYIEEALEGLEEEPASEKPVGENASATGHVWTRGKVFKSLRSISAIAALFCIIFTGLIGTMYYRTPIAYLSVDVNPSIEFSLNRWNYIVGVETFNKEGETICAKLKLKNKTCHTAFEHLFGNEDFASFVEKNGDLTVTIVADGAEKKKELSTMVENVAKEHQMEAARQLADRESLEKAHEEKCSVGKYEKCMELHSYDESYEIEDCKDLSIHELNEKIEDCKKAETEHHEKSETEHHGESKHEDAAEQISTPSKHEDTEEHILTPSKQENHEEKSHKGIHHEKEECHTIGQANKPKVPKPKPAIPQKVARSHRVSGSYKAKKEQERTPRRS